MKKKKKKLVLWTLKEHCVGSRRQQELQRSYPPPRLFSFFPGVCVCVLPLLLARLLIGFGAFGRASKTLNVRGSRSPCPAGSFFPSIPYCILQLVRSPYGHFHSIFFVLFFFFVFIKKKLFQRLLNQRLCTTT